MQIMDRLRSLIRWTRAISKYNKGKDQESLSFLNDLTLSDRLAVQAMLLRATIHHRMGDYQLAKSEYKNVCDACQGGVNSLDKNDSDYLWLYSDYYLKYLLYKENKIEFDALSQVYNKLSSTPRSRYIEQLFPYSMPTR